MTDPPSGPHPAQVTRELPSRRAQGFAVTCVAVPVLLAVIGLALSLTRPTIEDLVDGHEIGDAAMAFGCGAVAFVILSRLPRHPVGLTFAMIGGFDGLVVAASGLADALGPATNHAAGRRGVDRCRHRGVDAR